MLSLKEMVKQIQSFGNSELSKPCSEDRIQEYQKDNHFELPESYQKLIKCFNGGEIFIPGTIIYGIGNEDDIIKVNNSLRKVMSIPKEFLVFGKYNFGDYLCIEMKKPERIIQWDHENDKLYDQWSNLYDWLNELINVYIDEINGDQE